VPRGKSSKVNPRRRQRAEARRKDGLLTTGDMARLSQNTLRTVRFYEEEGLVSPGQRTSGGHRLFTLHELKKLLLITDLRAAGLTLEEIREMLRAKDRARTGAAASREVVTRIGTQLELMTTRVSLLRRLITELESTKKHLEECMDCNDLRRFSNGCKDCSRLRDDGSFPDALGVLWGVEA
jgi:DNA-binding transcriptional MerR regulator